MCIGFFREGQRRQKKRSLDGWKNEDETNGWFLEPRFYHKSLDGVAGGVSGFPLIKSEVLKALITWKLTSTSEVTAEAGKAVLEGQSSLDFSHTLVPTSNQTGPCPTHL